MNERPTLLLDPANPYDWEPGELEQFVRDLETETPGITAVPIRRPEEGYGGPFIEVLHVWQEYSSAVGGAATTAAATRYIIRALQKRWRQDREEHPAPEKPRPRTFSLYNENDELIRSVRIDLPDGEPVEEDIESEERAAHPRPSEIAQSKSR
jgi:hypothetical protein